MVHIDREKVAKLPVWAQELIKCLETANGPLLAEAARYRKEAEFAKTRMNNYASANQALMEILQCAKKGGSDFASQVVSVLEGYEIFRSTGESNG